LRCICPGVAFCTTYLNLKKGLAVPIPVSLENAQASYWSTVCIAIRGCQLCIGASTPQFEPRPRPRPSPAFEHAGMVCELHSIPFQREVAHASGRPRGKEEHNIHLFSNKKSRVLLASYPSESCNCTLSSTIIAELALDWRMNISNMDSLLLRNRYITTIIFTEDLGTIHACPCKANIIFQRAFLSFH
jgi:hypothetical protein